MFTNEIHLVNEELEAISSLYKNIPLNETRKKTFLDWQRLHKTGLPIGRKVKFGTVCQD